MKRGYCISFLLLFYFGVQANIITVSNSTAYVAQYTTIAAAVSAAMPNDTIYVYPSGSGNPYNEQVLIDKKLVIIGGGPYSNRVSKQGTWVDRFYLGSAANGSTISGFGLNFLELGLINSSTNVIDTINNIVVTDCHIKWTITCRGNNLLLENNIFGQNFTNDIYGATNIVLRNNIINGGVHLWNGVTGIIEHNLFTGTHNHYVFYVGHVWTNWGSGVTIKDNIFYNVEINGAPGDGVSATNDCPYINNIYFLSNNPFVPTPGSSGNMNVNPQFTNFPVAGSEFSINHDYRLIASSAGKNYATDGTDVGVWGGSSPINAWFEAPIPRVIQLEVSNSTVPAGGQIQLTIKATKAQ